MGHVCRKKEAVPHQAAQRWTNLALREDAKARRSITSRQTWWNTRASQEDLQSPFPSVVDILEPKVVWEHSNESLDSTIERVIVGDVTVSTSEDLSFPTLLDILEPKIVWKQAKGFDDAVGKIVQGTVSFKDFLQHFGKGGQPAHGVYEGSYKDLIFALNQLKRTLAQACECPETLQELPELVIEDEVKPLWSDFEPVLEPVPSKPQVKAMPVFNPPPFTPSVPFRVPDLPEVPLLESVWEDVPPPVWVEPEPPYIPDFVPWKYKDNVPHPVLPAPPVQLIGLPKDGPDWSGDHPYQLDTGHWMAPAKKRVLEVPQRPLKMPEAPEIMPPVQGLLTGTAPVLLLDHSGTMNPRIGGLFQVIQNAAGRLLCPHTGQVSKTAWKFDVIAFAGQATAWSQNYIKKQLKLEEDLTRGVGTRPNNGAPTPYSMLSPDKKTEYLKIFEQVAAAKGKVELLRATPDIVEDARIWVETLPLPAGVTRLQSAFELMENSESHDNCDSVYLFSDGKDPDPSGAFQALEDWRARKGRVPPFICVGFYPVGRDGEAGARFLKELAARTGGSYRIFDDETEALLTHRVASTADPGCGDGLPKIEMQLSVSSSKKTGGEGAQDNAHAIDDDVAEAEQWAENWLSSILKDRSSEPLVNESLGSSRRASLTDDDAIRKAIIAKNKQLHKEWAERRTKDMRKFREELYNTFAAHFADEIAISWGKEEAIAQREVEAEEQAQARKLAYIHRTNRSTRLRHHAEVEVRRQQEEVFFKGVMSCHEDRNTALMQYHEAVRKSIGDHMMAIATAAENHRLRAIETRRDARDSVWAAYQKVAEPLRKWNAVRAAEVQKQRDHHFAVVQQCENIVQAARDRYDQQVARERDEHSARLDLLRIAHEQECARTEERNMQALEDWAEAAKAAEAANREKLVRAQMQYQEAVEETRQAYLRQVEQAREDHRRALAEAQEHNERVRPMVDRAAKPARELQRVLVFAENIAKCAQKQCMGVNLQWMAVPQMDRVVEMTSLLESLQLAFQEFPIHSLPWPNREDPDRMPGTGCWRVDASPAEGRCLASVHTSRSSPQLGAECDGAALSGAGVRLTKSASEGHRRAAAIAERQMRPASARPLAPRPSSAVAGRGRWPPSASHRPEQRGRPARPASALSARGNRSTTTTSLQSPARPASALSAQNSHRSALIGRAPSARPSSAVSFRASSGLTGEARRSYSGRRGEATLCRPQTAPLASCRVAQKSTEGRISHRPVQRSPEMELLAMAWMTGSPPYLSGSFGTRPKSAGSAVSSTRHHRHHHHHQQQQQDVMMQNEKPTAVRPDAWRASRLQKSRSIGFGSSSSR